MATFIPQAWGNGGDRTTIPNTVQAGGVVWWSSGWGPNYALEQGVEPNALDVSRTIENEFKFIMSDICRELQQEGIIHYFATYDYLINAVVTGSDGVLYVALALNGPGTAVINPVGDLTEVWAPLGTGIRVYLNTVVYPIDSYVVGSGGVFTPSGFLYRAIEINGPGTGEGVVVPGASGSTDVWAPVGMDLQAWFVSVQYVIGEHVRASTGEEYVAQANSGPPASVNPATALDATKWRISGSDMRLYSGSVNYLVGNYAKGSDDQLYVCETDNGPGTSVVDPVGDLTGRWALINGGAGHPLPPTWIDGLIIANGGVDALHDIDIGEGSCRNAANNGDIFNAGIFTKRADAVWALGTNAGGFASSLGTLASQQGNWIGFFVISKSSGPGLDAGFDTSLTAAGLLADAAGSGFNRYRQIGWVLVEPSSPELSGFTVDPDAPDNVRLNKPEVSVLFETWPTSAVSRTAIAPPNSTAFLIHEAASGIVGLSQLTTVLISPLAAPDIAPVPVTVQTLFMFSSGDHVTQANYEITVALDVNSQYRWRADKTNEVTESLGVGITSLGFRYSRGRK